MYTYKSTYVQDPNKNFEAFSDTYDPSSRIRKKSTRKKVLRKVKKIKKESTINTGKARPLNYMPEKNLKEIEKKKQKLEEIKERRERLLVKQQQPQRRDTCLIACGRDIDDYEEKEKFTNTTDYDYVQAGI